MKPAGFLSRRWAQAALLTLLLVVTFSRSARAHDPFEITTVGLVSAHALELNVTMKQSVAERLAAKSARWDAGTLRASGAVDALAAELFVVTVSGEPLPFIGHRVTPRPDAELEFRLEFAPPQPGPLRLRARHLELLPEGYLNAVTLRSAVPALALGTRMLHAAEPVFEVHVPAAGPRARSEATLAEPWTARAFRFVKLGMHHVVTGYDHLLFLLGVLIPCRRVRTLLGLVTCFTLAHSATLLLSVLVRFDAPAAIVEPLIAASIVFVGVENLFRRTESRARYAVTFAFGLVHGLGFAGALADIGLGDAPALPLLSFNLGVELAQMALVAPLFPLLAWARTFPATTLATKALSAAIALAGVYWFVDRTLPLLRDPVQPRSANRPESSNFRVSSVGTSLAGTGLDTR